MSYPSPVENVFNPLTPTSDQYRISPYGINTISTRQVMRINWNVNVIDRYTIESAKAHNAKAAVSAKLLQKFILHIISVVFPKKSDKSIEQCFTITLNYENCKKLKTDDISHNSENGNFQWKSWLAFQLCMLDSRSGKLKWAFGQYSCFVLPSTPTGNLKLSGLFIELSNQWSKVKFELPDAEASGFYVQVTYLDSKPPIELPILAVYLAE